MHDCRKRLDEIEVAPIPYSGLVAVYTEWAGGTVTEMGVTMLLTMTGGLLLVTMYSAAAGPRKML